MIKIKRIFGELINPILIKKLFISFNKKLEDEYASSISNDITGRTRAKPNISNKSPKKVRDIREKAISFS
tara:strand:+ start:339 stop:548 length:210 start_codon:yes stop_codon:yes gene_type:complete